MIDIRPSILAADLLELKKDIERVAPYIKTLHFDVMDAHFVPNLSFGPSLLKQIKAAFPQISMDVHLMMDNPEMYIDTFAKAGADVITVHIEADKAIACVDKIHELGLAAGLSLKPATPAQELFPYLDKLEMVLIMTVEPGFGGQKFRAEMLEKATCLRSHGYKGTISVDGGVNEQNAKQITAAGVNALVMGTAVFKADDPGKVINNCKE